MAVVGGTGVLGRQVVAAAERAGHRAKSLSRATGFDLLAEQSAESAAALTRALEGTDAVIDAVNQLGRRRQQAVDRFSAMARRVVAAAASAGVGRYVQTSIVGVDRPGLAKMGYYQGKLAAERAAAETARLAGSTVQVQIVRSTQWYEFAELMLARFDLGPVRLAPKMLVQPVAAASVAELLVAVADGRVGGVPESARAASPDTARVDTEPADTARVDTAPADTEPSDAAVLEIGGPDQYPLGELMRRVAAAGGRRPLVLPIPVPGAAAAGAGALLPGPDAIIDDVRLDDWLATRPRAQDE